MSKVDALLDVALESIDGGLEKVLLVVVEVGEWVVRLLCTVWLLIYNISIRIF